MFHVNEESVLGIFHHIIPTKTADIHSVIRPLFQDLKQSLLLAPIQQNIDSSLKKNRRARTFLIASFLRLMCSDGVSCAHH